MSTKVVECLTCGAFNWEYSVKCKKCGSSNLSMGFHEMMK